MPRRNRNAWRDDAAKARAQQERVAGDVVRLRGRERKKRGRRDLGRAA